MSGERRDCSRTRGLIDRLVAGSVNDDDRRHAATCPSCRPVMVRAARFENELQRSAQQLIAEDLPHGILDPGLAGQVRLGPGLRLAPSAMAGFAALAIVVVATLVGVRPILLPAASPTDMPFAQDGPSAPPDAPLWSLRDLTVALAERLDYVCGAGEAPPTASSGEEVVGVSATCIAPPDARFTAAVTVDAAESGRVVEVTITADIVGVPAGHEAQRARDAAATALARVTAQAFAGEGAAIRAANFVFAKASQLSGPAWAMGIQESGVRVSLERIAYGGYIVHLSVAS